MSPLFCERQRLALRDFKHVAAARAELETATETEFHGCKERLEGEYQKRRAEIEEDYQDDLAAADSEAEQARLAIESQFEEDDFRLQEEFENAKKTAIERYVKGKKTAEADFKDSRWTITTLYESGRKVAKDQFAEAQTRAKSAVEHLAAQEKQALALLGDWQFDEGLPDLKQPGAITSDPWQALNMCSAQGTNFLSQLKSLKLPGYLKGARPYLVIALVWVVASLPALLVDEWYFWVPAATVVVLPFGLLIRQWLNVRAHTLAIYLWSGVRQANIDAGELQGHCIEMARAVYRERKSENKKRNQESLLQAARQTKEQIQLLRKERARKLRKAQETFEPLHLKIRENREQDLAAAQVALEEKKAEFENHRQHELELTDQRFFKHSEENNRKHADAWTRLVGDWKQGCQRFLTEIRAIDQDCRRWFPAWDDLALHDLKLPTEIPPGMQAGLFHIRPEDIPNGVPKENHLARLNLTGIQFPFLLPFPERASLLYKAEDEGKSAAIGSLQALLLRCWTALPAGKVRCTILDPVGRGENFAAFMHLADHEETLVNSRIWTEMAHIDQRLADLTSHMENVLQKYLRNQYETLAEYNAQAGEVAEPFRFLIVADFPVNFSPDAARRLISLASAGARCGIYTFIMVDTKQPLPQGIDLADLERVCTTLTWRRDHFTWEDADFGAFPLELESAPGPEACTRLLKTAGEEAKQAMRVEVPFDLIVPAREDWWAGDSRAGISVPLGRAGATARQFLNLGQGTAQHVLIAGKTGSGKSTLLHVLIAQLAMRYSPAEVELFLIDFKKGVEFKTYAANELPHARVVAIESEREFGLSVLQKLDGELVRRGEAFRAAGVNDLPSYRNLVDSQGNGKAGGHPVLPRLVLVVDEFQEFFVEDDKIAQEAALLLDRLVRQGRAFGIHILLGSQTLGGSYSLARSTIDQMAVRIALQCSEADAHLILSKDNSDARLLARPGEAIYNAAGGLLEGNHFFQVVWLDDERRDECIRQIRNLGRQRSMLPHQIVFEGNSLSDLAKNPLLRQTLEQPVDLPVNTPALGAGLLTPALGAGLLTPSTPVQAWLGEAVAIKDPTAAIFRRQSGGNLLIVGQQEEPAFSLTVAALVSLSAQLPPPDDAGPFLNLVVASPLEGLAESIHQLLPEIMPVRLAAMRDLPAALARFNEELERRLKGESDGPPHFLFLHGLHRLRDLRKPEDDFSFGRKGETATTPYKLFQQLLREGPPLGLFTVAWCDTLANLHRCFDRQGLREFEMRVLFQMSPNDSSTLMDVPTAARLGMYRALLYTEDQGRIEKFRPYGLPAVDWLRGGTRTLLVR